MVLLKSCSVPEKVKEKVFYGKYLEKSTFFFGLAVLFFFFSLLLWKKILENLKIQVTVFIKMILFRKLVQYNRVNIHHHDINQTKE